MPGSYFYRAGRDPIVLVLGIIVLLILVIVSGTIININCKENKIKKAFYLALFIQIGILIVDNYIKDFPLINVDARAHEGLAWFSYINNVNVGRGQYNTFLLNPIYKILGIRVAIIFGAINVVCHILININLYRIFNILKLEKRLKEFLLYIVILSPISLVYRAGVLREAIIIMFISYSLKNFIEYSLKKKIILMIKAFFFMGIGAIFHSGVVFLGVGYFLYLLGGRGNQKVFQFILFILAIGVFIIFKDQLLEKVGGGDVERILAYNNNEQLKSAGSGYLESITTDSLGQIGVFLPLFMFYFMYSPTPDMFRGILDIISFILNSSIYIYITVVGVVTYKNIRKKLSKSQKQIIKALFISVLFTIAVFSVGTRNAGTAMRHRDKILLFLIVIFAIIRNKYYQIKYEKLRRGIKGREKNGAN